MGSLENWPRWLRWLLVLPAAIASSLGIQLLVGIAHLFIEPGEVLVPFVGAMGDYFPQLANSIAGPYAFVWAGASLAPTRKKRVALVLATAMSLMLVAGTLWIFSAGRGSWWFLVTSAVAVAAALLSYYRWHLIGTERDAPSANSVPRS